MIYTLRLSFCLFALAALFPAAGRAAAVTLTLSSPLGLRRHGQLWAGCVEVWLDGI